MAQPRTTSITLSCPLHHPHRKLSNAERKRMRGASIHQGKQQNVDLMLTMVPQMAILAAPHLP